MTQIPRVAQALARITIIDEPASRREAPFAATGNTGLARPERLPVRVASSKTLLTPTGGIAQSAAFAPIRINPASPLARVKLSLAQWQGASPAGELHARQVAAGEILNTLQEQRLELSLDEYGLTSLPDCLDELSCVKSLSVADNKLSALPVLPAGLKDLSASRNRLTHLPHDLPVTIETLSIDENPLEALQSLPASLRRLFIRTTHLRDLPQLPAGLVELAAGDSRLMRLPAPLPEGLLTLQVAENNLGELPALPRSLLTLNVCGNLLQVLPALPPGLTTLTAARNRLVELPALPRSLQSLYVESNQLSTLRKFPSALTTIVAHSNRIESVAWLPRDLRTLDLRFNPLGQIWAPIAERLNAGVDCIEVLTQWQSFGPSRLSMPALPERWANNATNSGKWAFAETEENASAFNIFQARLIQTAEYKNPGTRPALAARVDRLVAAMQLSPSLRSSCFAIADTAITTCGDRVALGLNDMEVAGINHDAEAGKYDDQALQSLGINLFKLDAVNQIALARIEELKDRAVRIDEVEIRLAYQTALKKSLDLPGITDDMLYRACADLTPHDIDTAEKKVRSLLESEAPLEYLARWQPWSQAMQRNHPVVYAALSEAHQVARDALSIMPAHMSEQQWIDALVEMSAREASQVHAATLRFTREFLSE